MSMQFRLVSTMTAAAFAVMVGSSAFGQVQSKDQAKCINTLNKDTCKVAAAQGKNNSGCVKGATKGTPSATCVPNDGSGKVGPKETKTTDDETKNACLGANAPNFGYSSGATGNAAAVEAEVNLFNDTYGTTDTTGVISTAKADAKCQSAATKDLEKLMATKWKEYLKCKKTALASAATVAPLNLCMTGLPGDAKVVSKLTKLDADIQKDCVAPVVIAADFPGSCSGASLTGPSGLAVCLDKHAECRICKALNKIDGTTVDCDLFDDGLANNSCPPCEPSACPISTRGRYTETTGPGVLKVSTFAAFPFPAGSVTIQDVDCPDTNCVSQTVIPYPGGLTTPVFCVPALGYTVKVDQTGCGVGVLDSNGGSDLTVDEKGDTSFTSGSCAAGQSCAVVADSSGEITVKVGDGAADTCASGGTGNAMVSIPVETTTWLSTGGCPDPDMDDTGGDDTIITQFPQTLDQTTDRATAEFADNDGDTCFQKGVGPTGPFTTNQLCDGAGFPYPCCTGAGTGTCVGNGGVGTCIDFGGNTVTVAGTGTVFSSAAPLHDLLFANILPSTIAGPAAYGGATCGSPPPINFTGSAQRCIIAP